MRILLPTGAATESLVRRAAAGYDAEVVVTGEIASFLTPHALRMLLKKKKCDCVIVSGMCTASFEKVERETGVPIYRGPRHAADLALVLPLLGNVTFSRTIPADDFLAARKAEDARRRLEKEEQRAVPDFLIRGMKVGGGSRIKVLAEIMDAHRCSEIRRMVEEHLASGADIRADIVLSLQESNIPEIGKEVAEAGLAAVVVPGNSTLVKNIARAKKAGIQCIIADPLLQPAGSGFARSLTRFKKTSIPVFFGAGNVVELFDADSVGMNALLAGIAAEVGASVIFTSEHSDKTKGSVREMRQATEMMVLAKDRPYPKDLGIDLLILKEKRRRREPPLEYDTAQPARPMPDEITYDPRGNFRIGIEGDQIVAVLHGRAVKGKQWQDVLSTLLIQGEVTLLDHAGYLGRELYKAELAIRYGRSFEQDGEF